MKRHAKIDETCRCCWICGKRGGMGATLLLSLMGYDVARVPNSRAFAEIGYAHPDCLIRKRRKLSQVNKGVTP